MANETIRFKTKEMTEHRTFEYDMPTDLDGLRAKFGDEAVYDAAKGSFVISLQALGRRHIGKTDAEISELAKSWNPNERAPAAKATPFERATAQLGKLTAEERKELIARLRAG